MVFTRRRNYKEDDSDQDDPQNMPVVLKILTEMNLPDGCTANQIAGQLKLLQPDSRHSKSSTLQAEVRHVLRHCLFVGLIEENRGRYVIKPVENDEKRGEKRHRSSTSVESTGQISNSTTTDGYITPDNEQDEPKCSKRRPKKCRKRRRRKSSSSDERRMLDPSSSDDEEMIRKDEGNKDERSDEKNKKKDTKDDRYNEESKQIDDEDERPMSPILNKHRIYKRKKDCIRPQMDDNNTETNDDAPNRDITEETAKLEPEDLRRMNQLN